MDTLSPHQGGSPARRPRIRSMAVAAALAAVAASAVAIPAFAAEGVPAPAPGAPAPCVVATKAEGDALLAKLGPLNGPPAKPVPAGATIVFAEAVPVSATTGTARPAPDWRPALPVPEGRGAREGGTMTGPAVAPTGTDGAQQAGATDVTPAKPVPEGAVIVMDEAPVPATVDADLPECSAK